MNAQALAVSIDELSGMLRPGNGKTEADLERGRLLLARALQTGQTPAEVRGATLTGSTPQTHTAERFLHLFESKPGRVVRAFIRTVPSPTSLHSSTPEWARGIAVAHSAGPFLTPLGFPVWFDAFDPIQITTLTRDSATLGL
jgi:hypothetical protein